MKIVAISDTHNKHNKLIIPKCDLLIHAGDWSFQGKESEVRNFAKWLDKQTQCENIVVIPGNHELEFEKQLPLSKTWFQKECPWAHLLIEEEVIINGIKIFGSPIQPEFCNWAWNRYPEGLIKAWNKIPDDTNILISHGPPYDILDKTTYANGDPRPEPLGCSFLLHRIKQLKDLSLHFFGHIHWQGGQTVNKDGVSYFNAAICDELYLPTNPITIVDFNKEEG
jgi:Icc-related predicted phosphoesterase